MDYSRVPLLSDHTYHVFNRAVGNDKLFLKDNNYIFFLEKYQKYISQVADTYCYCLMPNHFHLLIKIKSEDDLITLIGNSQKRQNLSAFVSQQFGNFFNSYTKSFNKAFNRRGSLFMKPFKRKLIGNENYFRKVVHYIHYNPVKANLVSKPSSWKYSSYNALIQQSPSKINRLQVIEWFDDIGNTKKTIK